MFEIRKLKSHANCGRSRSGCDTHKDHPNWPVIEGAGRNIPKGEYALYNSAGEYYLCKKHALIALNQVKIEIAHIEKQAADLGWI